MLQDLSESKAKYKGFQEISTRRGAMLFIDLSSTSKQGIPQAGTPSTWCTATGGKMSVCLLR